MVKKIIFLSFIIVISLFSNASGADPYYFSRPQHNPYEKWNSEDYNIYFMGWDNEEQAPVGSWDLSNSTLSIEMFFKSGRDVEVLAHGNQQLGSTNINDQDVIFCGICEFDRTDLKITVTKDPYRLFSSNNSTLVFTKEIIDAQKWGEFVEAHPYEYKNSTWDNSIIIILTLIALCGSIIWIWRRSKPKSESQSPNK